MVKAKIKKLPEVEAKLPQKNPMRILSAAKVNGEAIGESILKFIEEHDDEGIEFLRKLAEDTKTPIDDEWVEWLAENKDKVILVLRFLLTLL